MSRRRALIVGIDHYQQEGMTLSSAVADARAMASLLGTHQDGMANYDCRLWADKTHADAPITCAALRQEIQELVSEFRGEILLYFAGHGSISSTGGWLVTYDGTRNNWGISMEEVFKLAFHSQARDILLVLDCCHAGDFGSCSLQSREKGSWGTAVLREDMTIIAGSMPREVSRETSGHGLFTAAVIDALEGGAADTMGWVTAPSIYAYVERRFGGWSQQPVYKSHATQVNVIRQCAPLIDRLKLRRLVKEFPSHDFRLQLCPEMEPEDTNGEVRLPGNAEKVEFAGRLKEYRDAGLIKPSENGEQLYWTARNSHTVELTPRGKEYWWLVREGKL